METELKAVELRELWRRCKEENDETARELLVVAYSPLVKYVAGRVGSRLPAHVDQGDLISDGLIGLMGAIDRYDPDRQVRFRTFALSRIRGSMIDGLRALDWVPRSVRTKAREVERAHVDLERELQRGPTEEEVAERLGVSLEEFQATLLRIAHSSILALDDPWGFPESEGGQATLLDTLADTKSADAQQRIDAEELRHRVAAAIVTLPDRERLVIGLYYYKGLALREIGEVLGVTESRASQLHTKAVIGLRAALGPAA
jgi:RNA polymerase sigma factor for flagellar operon FliA